LVFELLMDRVCPRWSGVEGVMPAWRRAIELSLGDSDTSKLRSIAQSRTEPAGRVERARKLLAYREDPSFFAVGRAPGLHHQTVQRSNDEKPVSRRSRRPPRICRPSPASTRPSHVSMNISATARSACWPASTSSPARSMRWSRIAIAAANSSNSSSFSRRPLEDFHLAIDAQQSRDRAVPGSIALCAASPLLGRGSCTPCHAPDWRGTHVPAPVRARERDGREARSSTVRGDSRSPSPSGTPATPAMPWPPA
jgi:hypothetical protein